MTKKDISNFDVIKAMSEQNKDIRFAPLSNVEELSYDIKKGTMIKIGFPGNICFEWQQGKFGGGLLLYDIEQFNTIKKELDNRINTEVKQEQP